MKRKMNRSLLLAFVIVFLRITALPATETENLGIRALPAPGSVIVDGKTDDWDLSAGVFTCGDVENRRDTMATWFHAMYDANNLYVLTRWNDETPLNNPGQTIADYGFRGDCLQFRIITHPGGPNERTSHWTCWRGQDGADVMVVEYGKQLSEGYLKNAKMLGAQQALLIDSGAADSTGAPQPKGYVQEIAVPWSLLLKEGQPTPKAGEQIVLAIELNFTVGQNGRGTLKDNFKPGIPPNRVMTFTNSECWGYAILERSGKVEPSPVRLGDAREFPVKLELGRPVVDWTGLIKSKAPKGFKVFSFTMSEDGYISLNIKDHSGQPVCQLLNAAFYTKGRHDVLWDGLTTMNWHTPGQLLPPGEYSWDAIWHKGIGLRLVGWACNGGNAPWDSGPTSNWGGDHGQPAACAADGERVFLGWSASEGGKALLACDLNGNVLWNNFRGGTAAAGLLAVDAGVVYVQDWDGTGGRLYRLDAATGRYLPWTESDAAILAIPTLWGNDSKKPPSANAMDVKDGRLCLAFTPADAILVVDSNSGKLIKQLHVAKPSDVKASAGKLYVVSEGKAVLSINPETGETATLVSGLQNAQIMAFDGQGRIYVGLREPDNQVLVFDHDGKPTGQAIGRKGGRGLLGPWTPDGMAFIASLAVDSQGKLWVAEGDYVPKRFSCWDTKSGQLVKEYFGPPSYGALGGAINPQDPYLMVGQGCEWRIDPRTGRADCLGVIARDGMEVSRFGIGSNGKLYLAVATRWTFELAPIEIFERLGDGNYKLRTTITYIDKNGKDIPITPGPPPHMNQVAKTALWCDENDDGQRQENETSVVDGMVRLAGWYMGMTPDLRFYTAQTPFPSTPGQFKVTGFTACGAPKYDLAHPVKLPAYGLGSADGRLLLEMGQEGAANGWNRCFDIATGKQVWTYPDNFVHIAGTQNAPPPEVGMIRGSFGPCGTAALPKPIGNIWVIATNFGEWHILTEQGFYLTHLFEPNPLKVRWPQSAVPGARMDQCPCGAGGEDFGGSIVCTKEGKLYLQAGKTGFWNVEVTGLDQVQAMPGSAISISASDVQTAQAFHDDQLQAAVGKVRVAIKKMTPRLTEDFNADFRGAEIIGYKKQDEAAIRSAAAWDDRNLYLAWEVTDDTPWINGATDVTQMYIGGDTVDLQLGTDPAADKSRDEAQQGDLRLSIGNFQGQPTAVLYRRVSSAKKPAVFSSGVVKSYPMDFVDVVLLENIKVKVNPGKGYLVEAAIPLATVGLQPASGLTLRGDVGVTHGDRAGARTRLRSYWANQHTGLVDDAVFELKMQPMNWGELIFQ
ncbi:MAG TPA: PQQ-binding-like beta-propeller repeat protein [Pirellulales bacterium]|jgi:outer membrane protein assembly factor BamB|nr:PQQ-binding-like beta-propeller repeat protein [Pirellulales bacterium]